MGSCVTSAVVFDCSGSAIRSGDGLLFVLTDLAQGLGKLS